MFYSSDYWTQQRRELLEWFRDYAPSFVEGYASALYLLYNPTFPARIHLICHITRDIYWRLPAVLGIKSLPRPAEVFPEMVKELVRRWEKDPPSEPNSYEEATPEVLINTAIYNYVKKIVNKSVKMKENHSTVGKRLAIALYRVFDRQESEFISPQVIDSFNSEYNFFVTKAHLVESIDKIPTDDGLNKHFEAFERAFHSLVGSYFTGKEELDDILCVANKRTD